MVAHLVRSMHSVRSAFSRGSPCTCRTDKLFSCAFSLVLPAHTWYSRYVARTPAISPLPIFRPAMLQGCCGSGLPATVFNSKWRCAYENPGKKATLQKRYWLSLQCMISMYMWNLRSQAGSTRSQFTHLQSSRIHQLQHYLHKAIVKYTTKVCCAALTQMLLGHV